jgi:phasin
MATAPKKIAASAAPAAVEADAPFEAEAPVVAATPAPAIAAPLAEFSKAFEAPVASLTELQGNLRSVVEKGLSEARDVCAKAKTVADDAANAVESSYTVARAGAIAINAKALEALRANVNANLDFFKSAFAVKNVADYVTLQSEFARKQIDALTGQTKEIGALAQKVATETAEPIKEQVAKSFKIAS